MVKLEVILHYPKTEQGCKELYKAIASVHTEAVRNYLSKLPCPKEQKVLLLQSLQETVKNEQNAQETKRAG